MIKVIKGINGSKAIFKNSRWTVYGAHHVLQDQESSEYAYTVDKSFDELNQLSSNTPIYASVNCFENSSQTQDYKTVKDLFKIAKQTLKSIEEHESNPLSSCHFDPNKQLKKNLLHDTIAINSIAKHIFDEITWQSFESYSQDLYVNILLQPDSYEELFEPRKLSEKEKIIMKLHDSNLFIRKHLIQETVSTVLLDEYGYEEVCIPTEKSSSAYYTLEDKTNHKPISNDGKEIRFLIPKKS